MYICGCLAGIGSIKPAEIIINANKQRHAHRDPKQPEQKYKYR